VLRGDPDDLPARVWFILAILIAGGWAAGSFHTLARLMAPDASHEERLRVWQGIMASIAAGVLGFLGVLSWTEWGRMGAYFVGFILAYAGTLALDGARDALISGMKAMFQAFIDRTGPKKP
jgi:hypothetical protein